MKRSSILGLCLVLVSAASPAAATLYDCLVTGARYQTACCCPAGDAGSADPAQPCASSRRAEPRTGLSAPPRPCCEVRYDPGAPASSPGAAVASPASRTVKLFDHGDDGPGSVPSIASHSAALAALGARPDDLFAVGPPGPSLHVLACSFRC
jgi:hypothetical protein